MGKVFADWMTHNMCMTHQWNRVCLLIRFLPFYKHDLIRCNTTSHSGIRQLSSYLICGGSFCTWYRHTNRTMYLIIKQENLKLLPLPSFSLCISHTINIQEKIYMVAAGSICGSPSCCGFANSHAGKFFLPKQPVLQQKKKEAKKKREYRCRFSLFRHKPLPYFGSDECRCNLQCCLSPTSSLQLSWNEAAATTAWLLSHWMGS